MDGHQIKSCGLKFLNFSGNTRARVGPGLLQPRGPARLTRTPDVQKRNEGLDQGRAEEDDARLGYHHGQIMDRRIRADKNGAGLFSLTFLCLTL
jgi:hypothetical protein